MTNALGLAKLAAMRAVALNPKQDNFLDHLGVLAAILDIPLIVSEKKTNDLAALFYPQVKTILMDEQEITLEYLALNFDVLFVTSKLWAIELYPLFPLLFQKNMRVIYCPHGNSDKGHTLSDQIHNPEDISLVYGDHMLDLLKDIGMLDTIQHTLVTGNYRHSFFLQNQPFYQTLTQKKVFSKLDLKKKTIFYAPTWHCEESPSSFYQECAALIDQITPPFNLLVKLHPSLYEQHPAQTTAIYEKYKDHPQVLFLEDFPPIYPLLALSDAYLGDFSSIGYDFLTFNKPMYFFNPANSDLKKDRSRFIHQCGMEVSTKKQENVFDFISKTLEQNQTQFSPFREKIYSYAFGEKKALETLKKEINSLIL
ncbi:MAG TPA: CDP-glycerol glycerophosphotransferase family protein [Chlamydiales bacterium]